jgi:hypothetical protein
MGEWAIHGCAATARRSVPAIMVGLASLVPLYAALMLKQKLLVVEKCPHQVLGRSPSIGDAVKPSD